MGVENWPYWHYGVLLLYGQNVGLNHLIGSKQLNVVKLEDLLDFPSANNEIVNRKLHIHVFHGDNLFSKFAFDAGKYKDMNLTDYMNMNSSLSYATTIAISSDRLTLEEFKVYISDPLAIKEKAWIRQFPVT